MKDASSFITLRSRHMPCRWPPSYRTISEAHGDDCNGLVHDEDRAGRRRLVPSTIERGAVPTPANGYSCAPRSLTFIAQLGLCLATEQVLIPQINNGLHTGPKLVIDMQENRIS